MINNIDTEIERTAREVAIKKLQDQDIDYKELTDEDCNDLVENRIEILKEIEGRLKNKGIDINTIDKQDLEALVEAKFKEKQTNYKTMSLWKRTKAIASLYTGTFIVVMTLNQLLFFGFCLNPICLVAAMPHVLFITVLIGSWLNKESGWRGLQ